MKQRDEFGNILTIEGADVSLRLARLGHSRHLGELRGNTWFVHRLTLAEAKALGHFLFAYDGWGLNKQLTDLCPSLGVSFVDFHGYDGEDKEHHIVKPVADCRKLGVILFQDYEKQYLLPRPRPKPEAEPEAQKGFNWNESPAPDPVPDPAASTLAPQTSDKPTSDSGKLVSGLLDFINDEKDPKE